MTVGLYFLYLYFSMHYVCKLIQPCKINHLSHVAFIHWCNARYLYSNSLLSVRLSHSGVVSKRLNLSNAEILSPTYRCCFLTTEILSYEIWRSSLLTGASSTGGYEKPPSTSSQNYNLRPRPHSQQLPQPTGHLTDSNFSANKLLYLKKCYKIDQ